MATTAAATPSPPQVTREIERKFLVPELPSTLAKNPSADIIQGYLCSEEGRCQVRVRRVIDERFSSPEYYLTAKRKEGLVRDEVNVPLSPENFENLWAMTVGRRLHKRRYYIPYRRLTIELDVFEDARSGLLLAEVEFRDEAGARRFTPPAWLGPEVTKNPAYRNSVLAGE